MLEVNRPIYLHLCLWGKNVIMHCGLFCIVVYIFNLWCICVLTEKLRLKWIKVAILHLVYLPVICHFCVLFFLQWAHGMIVVLLCFIFATTFCRDLDEREWEWGRESKRAPKLHPHRYHALQHFYYTLGLCLNHDLNQDLTPCFQWHLCTTLTSIIFGKKSFMRWGGGQSFILLLRLYHSLLFQLMLFSLKL